jgi:hypothetical protein
MSEVLPKPPSCTPDRTRWRRSRFGSPGRSLLAVIVGCVSLLIIAPPALAQTGKIFGDVEEFASKKGLPGILVRAYGENGKVAGSATTVGVLGEYAINGLAIGKYKVEFSGGGFVPRFYKEAVSLSEATFVTIEKEGETKLNTNASMRKVGAISGRVTDAATNFPLANVSVTATNTTLVSFRSQSVVTNGNGEYTVPGLEASAYTLEFTAPEYVARTFPNIVVTEGVTTRGINVPLVRRAPPVNTGLPSLSGNPAVGQKLSCSNGTWSGLAPITFSYAWLREGGPIGGAAGNTYVVQPADQGHGLACRVTAANSVASVSATSNTLKVPPPPPPLSTVTSVSQSNSRWREGNRLATYSRTKRPPVGTTFRFVLNQRSTVSFAFTQQVGGRKVNGKCVAQTKANSRKPGCKRTVTQGTLTFVGRSGLNKVAFQGRISRSKKLPLGAYTLQITALNPAGQRSSPRTLKFTVVK